MDPSHTLKPARFPCDQGRDRRGGTGKWRMTTPPRVGGKPMRIKPHQAAGTAQERRVGGAGGVGAGRGRWVWGGGPGFQGGSGSKWGVRVRCRAAVASDGAGADNPTCENRRIDDRVTIEAPRAAPQGPAPGVW